jgi:hypothetical protein
MERGGAWVHDASTIHVPGLSKEYEDYVHLYGEENAKYIMETLTTSQENALTDGKDDRIVFVDTPELSHLGFAEMAKAQAEGAGKRFVKINGSTRLIRCLINGEWNDEDFLVLHPGEKIGGVYDWDRIVKAEGDQ